MVQDTKRRKYEITRPGWDQFVRKQSQIYRSVHLSVFLAEDFEYIVLVTVDFTLIVTLMLRFKPFLLIIDVGWPSELFKRKKINHLVTKISLRTLGSNTANIKNRHQISSIHFRFSGRIFLTCILMLSSHTFLGISSWHFLAFLNRDTGRVLNIRMQFMSHKARLSPFPKNIIYLYISSSKRRYRC
jgi:hypothetical protein